MSPEWASAIGDFLSGLGVITGLLIGLKQLSSWREQQVSAKKAALAEEVLLKAYQFDDLLRSARARYTTYYQRNGESSEEAYYRDLQERLSPLSDHFKELRTAQIRSLAILGNKAVDVAFNDLRMVGHDALDAHVELKELKTSDISPSNRDEIPELRRQAFGSYYDNDKLGQKQIKAIKTLEDELRPLISLQQA